LKKQSQFQKGRMSVSIYLKWDYEEFHALKAAENKAKQSQFLYRQPGSPFIMTGLSKKDH